MGVDDERSVGCNYHLAMPSNERPKGRQLSRTSPIISFAIVAAAFIVIGTIALAIRMGSEDDADSARSSLSSGDTTSSSDAMAGHDHKPSEFGYFPLGTKNGRNLYRYSDGTVLITEFDIDAAPTPTQQEAADSFAAQTTDALLSRWQNLEDAVAAGYERFDDVHWMRFDSIVDGSTLNVNDPESLMYAQDPDTGEWILVSAMFVAPYEVHGEQIGGPLTVWHFHDYDPPMCMRGNVWPLSDAPADPTMKCPDGSTRLGTSPEMLHVWIANPVGRFEHDMNVTPETIQATKSFISEWNQKN